MVSKPYLITAAGSNSIDLTDAKLHCRVDHSVEDALISSLVAAAEVAFAEDSGYVPITSTWEQAFADWPCDYFELDRYPASAITSVKYTMSDDTEGTVDSGTYFLSTATRKPRVYLKYGQSWPNATRQPGPTIRVRFAAGNASATAVPKDIIAALKVKIGELYVDRDGMAELRSKNTLIGADRVWRWATTRYRLEA